MCLTSAEGRKKMNHLTYLLQSSQLINLHTETWKQDMKWEIIVITTIYG